MSILLSEAPMKVSFGGELNGIRSIGSRSSSISTAFTDSETSGSMTPLKVDIMQLPWDEITKNTFIHFADHSVSDIDPLHVSAPPGLETVKFQTKETQESLHYKQLCRPCVYQATRADGCRAGDDCPFCHLCTKTDLKNRKKMKKQLLKAAGVAAAEQEAAALA
jgi:hypothetical protein